MTRRTILLALAVLPARGADPAEQAWDLLTRMASYLSQGDAPGFLRCFDRGMKGFVDLSVAVRGLVAEEQLESAIDPVENTGNANQRNVKVEWALRLISRSGLDQVKDRQATVTLRLERQHGKWKVVACEPFSLFAPPSAGMDLAHERSFGGLLLERQAEVGDAMGSDVLHPDGDGA